MMEGQLVHAYAFGFCFAASFLMTGKRPILTLSTRLVLVAALGCAFGYVLSEHNEWHTTAGIGMLILNVVFIGCALIDYVNWHARKASR